MGPLVIGVAGGSASGKTTVVNRLVEAIGAEAAAVLAHDRYYRDHGSLTPGARAAINYDHPDALDTDLLVVHLAMLRSGAPIDAPIYDFARHARRPECERIYPRPAILVEGILVLADPRLRALMDLKVYVDTDDATRLARRLERDTLERGRSRESVLAQVAATVQPMHRVFVEPSRHHADLVVAGRGDEAGRLSAVLSRIRHAMSDQAQRRAR